MSRVVKNKPMIGEAFNLELMNMGDVFELMADELFYYMPNSKSARVRAKLSMAKEAYRTDDSDDVDGILGDTIQTGHEALNDAESLLSEWAQSVERHDYIYFVVDGPFAGFRINVEDAVENADWLTYDRWNAPKANPHQPGDGAGLEVIINDHGNVTAWIYGANGHKREIFSVV